MASILKLQGDKKTGPKSIDFRNPSEKVDIEVEFGNVASFYRDVFKFNISKKAGEIDVGILIAGNKRIANTVGENVASYERIKEELKISWGYGANADCPVMIYGILPVSYPGNRCLIDKNAAKSKKELQDKRSRRRKLTRKRRRL